MDTFQRPLERSKRPAPRGPRPYVSMHVSMHGYEKHAAGAHQNERLRVKGRRRYCSHACGRADDRLGQPFAMEGEGHKRAHHQNGRCKP